MDVEAKLDIKFRGGISYNLKKKIVDMEEEDLTERINALDDLDDRRCFRRG